jgi:hypothetical protein
MVSRPSWECAVLSIKFVHSAADGGSICDSGVLRFRRRLVRGLLAGRMVSSVESDPGGLSGIRPDAWTATEERPLFCT